VISIVRGKIAELAREPLLSPDEERRAHSRSFVAGRTLLRRVLGKCLDRDPRPIRFIEDDKPRLAYGDLGFNVAHGGEYVLVAVARDRNIGVDVEPVDHRRAVGTIAEIAIGADAAFELEHLPAERRAARFTSWWVRIEALCKATGAGLMFPVETEAPGFSVRDVAMPAGYHAAVAFDGAPTRITTQDWSPA
jgi:4'-phosphopantetheinyl transferase